MNTAIIAEYNPFHKGHLYHINKTKEKTGDSNIIAIMSGNFTQRGEPAILDKVLRTKMALLNGVDTVSYTHLDVYKRQVLRSVLLNSVLFLRQQVSQVQDVVTQ